MTRAEHVEWCKQRAREYLDKGDVTNAFASMMSDLRKHSETADHPAIELGMMLLLSGNIKSSDDARKFIDGFN